MNALETNKAMKKVAAPIERHLDEVEIPRDPPDPSEYIGEPAKLLEEPAFATDCPTCGGPALVSEDGDLIRDRREQVVFREVTRA